MPVNTKPPVTELQLRERLLLIYKKMLVYNKMEQPPRGSAETAALPAVSRACQRGKHPRTYNDAVV